LPRCSTMSPSRAASEIPRTRYCVCDTSVMRPPRRMSLRSSAKRRHVRSSAVSAVS
jgi:hypothetical protein